MVHAHGTSSARTLMRPPCCIAAIAYFGAELTSQPLRHCHHYRRCARICCTCLRRLRPRRASRARRRRGVGIDRACIVTVTAVDCRRCRARRLRHEHPRVSSLACIARQVVPHRVVDAGVLNAVLVRRPRPLVDARALVPAVGVTLAVLPQHFDVITDAGQLLVRRYEFYDLAHSRRSRHRRHADERR